MNELLEHISTLILRLDQQVCAHQQVHALPSSSALVCVDSFDRVHVLSKASGSMVLSRAQRNHM